MHPLRLPNSGIRAKVFVQKIGFKLRVMRLNRLELFYELVTAIGSESKRCLQGRGGHMYVVYSQGPPARWQSAAARPPTRGYRPQGQPPTGIAGYGQPSRQQGRRCQPQRTALSPTGAATAPTQ
ncbi:hypothetical protein BHE74_00030803 [Ensete ventricosum]|nr:hypothetical protein BHE74_00030803 [Ensete ventricosum]